MACPIPNYFTCCHMHMLQLQTFWYFSAMLPTQLPTHSHALYFSASPQKGCSRAMHCGHVQAQAASERGSQADIVHAAEQLQVSSASLAALRASIALMQQVAQHQLYHCIAQHYTGSPYQGLTALLHSIILAFTFQSCCMLQHQQAWLLSLNRVCMRHDKQQPQAGSVSH